MSNKELFNQNEHNLRLWFMIFLAVAMLGLIIIVKADHNPTTEAAQSVISTQNQYYELDPEEETAVAIFESIKNARPWIAVTNFNLYITYVRHYSMAQCEIRPTVYLEIDYEFPVWPGYDNAPPPLQAEWRRFMKHVVAHEEHHGAILKERQGMDASFAATVKDLAAKLL